MLTDYPNIPDRGPELSPQSIAIISFFLLFPGYFFYHQSMAMGLIQPFAAGLFGYVSLGALMAFLALLPWNPDWLKKAIRNRYILWVLAFIIYASVWTFAHYLMLSGDYITKASLQSLETVIFWGCLFLIGLILPLESKTLRWSFFISFIAIFGFLLYFFISTGNHGYNARRLYNNDMADLSTYQGFARSVMFSLLLLIAVFNSFRARAFYILGGVFTLYLLISRSDFYAFIALSVVFCIISGIKQPRYFVLLLLLSLQILLLAMPDIVPRVELFSDLGDKIEKRLDDMPDIELPVGLFSKDSVAEKADPAVDSFNAATQALPPDNSSLPDKAAPAPGPGQAGTGSAPDKTAAAPRLSRQFEVLDFYASSSWADRLYLQGIALEHIAENPLMGKFGGHVLQQETDNRPIGHVGRYAHNVLSAWVGYGLIGFLIYVSLTLLSLLVATGQFVLKRQDTPLWTFAFMLNFVCLLMIIVSKPVYWPLPALGWGVLAQALSRATSAPGWKSLLEEYRQVLSGPWLNRNTLGTY